MSHAHSGKRLMRSRQSLVFQDNHCAVGASKHSSDTGQKAGVTREEHEEIRRLKRENSELRRANEILKLASAFFAAELDRPGSP